MKTYDLEKWNMIKSMIDQLSSEGAFIWRGQTDAKYNLSSSLFRYFRDKKIQKSDQLDLELNGLNYFAETTNNTSITPFKKEAFTKVELMNLLQHYGCPTRLLDWTLSPYIATYFSLCGIAHQRSLYALNLGMYSSLVGKAYSQLDSMGGLIVNINDQSFMELINSSIYLPLPIKPAAIFERPLMQKSIFLLDLSLEDSLETSIESLSSNLLVKINFPDQILNEAINDIELMNIDGYHLFGGIEGAAYKTKEIMGLNR